MHVLTFGGAACAVSKAASMSWKAATATDAGIWLKLTPLIVAYSQMLLPSSVATNAAPFSRGIFLGFVSNTGSLDLATYPVTQIVLSLRPLIASLFGAPDAKLRKDRNGVS